MIPLMNHATYHRLRELKRELDTASPNIARVRPGCLTCSRTRAVPYPFCGRGNEGLQRGPSRYL